MTGAAFGKIVSAVVADFIMPVVALVMPSGDWRASGLVLRHAVDPKDDVVVKYGDFLGVTLDFLIVALMLFLIVSKIVKAAEARIGSKDAPAPAATKECKFCLETIPVKAVRGRACASEVS